MRKQEILAGLLVALVLLGTPAAVLAYQLNRVADRIIVHVDQERGFAPGEIYVKPGEKVKLEIHADDVIHGVQSKRLGVKVESIYPGKPVIIEFTAPTEPGEYSFICAKMCGPTHVDMVGKVIVLP